VKLAVGGIGLLAFALPLLILLKYNDGIPHVPDEVAYIFQAKVLASGHVAAAPPPDPAAFSFFFPDPIRVNSGHWAAVVPFGHPLILALGQVVGLLWLIPPLVGAATVFGVQLIGLRIYRVPTALLAGLLLLFSPFFLMTASNFMSHNTAALYLVAFVLCLIYVDRRPLLLAFLAGLSFGLLFNTRPLTAIGLLPAGGMMVLYSFRAWELNRELLRRLGAFAAGGLLLLGAYLLYNLGTTGSLFQSGYQATGTLDEVVGFGGRHSVARGLQNEFTQLSFLLLVLNGWPVRIGLGLVLLPFLLGTKKPWDWLFLFGAASTMAVYVLFESNGVMHGPRYWYEATPLLILLTARGLERAAEVIRGVAALFPRSRPEKGDLALADLLVPGVGVVLVAISSVWLLGGSERWHVPEVPGNVSALHGFNGVNDGLIRELDEAQLDNALVLVKPCGSWQCLGNVFWLNAPALNGSVVYAADIPARNPTTFAAFPDRRVYQADYQKRLVQPDGSTLTESDVVSPGPYARDIEPSPAPADDIPAKDAVRARDLQRQEDLEAVKDALYVFAAEAGEFPISRNIQSLCVYSTDAACALNGVMERIPRDPSPSYSYWYQSSGAEFTLFAGLEEEGAVTTCSPRPSHLAAYEALLCVSGQLP
jgi:hypothetical protein